MLHRSDTSLTPRRVEPAHIVHRLVVHVRPNGILAAGSITRCETDPATVFAAHARVVDGVRIVAARIHGVQEVRLLLVCELVLHDLE